MYRIRALSMSFALAAAVAAQGGVATGATEDAAAALTPLQKVLKAKAGERPAALVALIEDQLATDAVYAGQYAGLREIQGDVVPLMQEWMVESPEGVKDDAAFRTACIQVLRDVVTGEAPDELRGALEELAADEFEEPAVRRSAAFALAQFGDRKLVNEMIRDANQQTAASMAQQRFNGWNTLSGIYYNLREYGEAVKAYKQAIRLLENAGQKEGMESIYYNCACSMALAGDIDDAFEYLEKAMKAGQANGKPLSRRMIDTDMDIAALRRDERFAALVEKYHGGKGGAPRDGDR